MKAPEASQSLCEAIERGDTKKVQSLLEEGADPNSVKKSQGQDGYYSFDEYGDSYFNGYTYYISIPLLHLSAHHGRNEIISLLIEKGADIKATTENKGALDKNLAIHVAARQGHAEAVELLCKAGIPAYSKLEQTLDSPLHLACAGGHIRVVQVLVKQGSVNINERNKNKQTPLHLACKAKQLELVKLLVENGANVNDNEEFVERKFYAAHAGCGWVNMPAVSSAPLHCAVDAGSQEIVVYLLDKGANIEALSNDGSKKETVLQIARRKNNQELVELLLARGAH